MGLLDHTTTIIAVLVIFISTEYVLSSDVPEPNVALDTTLLKSPKEADPNNRPTIAVESDKSKSSLKEDVLDSWIDNYLKVFDIVKMTMSEDDQKAMEVVKKLMIQSWISTLHPNVVLVKYTMPAEDSTTLEDIKKDIIKSIKELEKPAVEKAVIHYGSKISGAIKERIKNEATKLQYGKQMVSHICVVHDWYCVRMSMQSFIFDFVPEPYGNSYVFKTCDGQDVKVDITKYTVTDWEMFYKI